MGFLKLFLFLSFGTAQITVQAACDGGTTEDQDYFFTGTGSLLDSDRGDYTDFTSSTGSPTTVGECSQQCIDDSIDGGCFFAPGSGTVKGGLVGFSWDAENLRKCICWHMTGTSLQTNGETDDSDNLSYDTYCYSCVSSQPSSQPSENPSSNPSSNPSEEPSSNPSQNPSSQPSGTPSQEPSSIPSDSPSSQPSGTPSEEPSSIPSQDPSSQPSGTPSETPSSLPSSIPSGQPSSIPSEMPSGQPSSQPSGQPSSVPSEMPSGQPSLQPSYQPSSQPSSRPSSQPSSQPSGQPSSLPSTQPSSQPSGRPSGQPSSLPSTQPSSQPSGQPSGEPTSQPSGEPTSQPSESPSAVPSCTPSSAPTDPATIFLFYPDWSPGGKTCRNDGNTPPYMEANPRDYLFSNLVACCITWFSWNVETCMGVFPGPCARALFYPDWDGANVGCIDDGNEPDYMRDNAMDYLYSQLEDCCSEHYSWNYFECMNTPARLNIHLYYPDWERTDTCADGGGQPAYMNYNVDIWMFDTLDACCAENFPWLYNDCVTSGPTTSGSRPAPAPGTSLGTSPANPPGMYYPAWSIQVHTCLNDNNQPSYMSNSPSHWMYHTLEACCNRHFLWKLNSCITNSPLTESLTTSSGSTNPRPTSPAVTSAAVTSGTGKFYLSWRTPSTCVQDCVGSTPSTCGGLAQQWNHPLYDTLKECCLAANWWNSDCNVL